MCAERSLGLAVVGCGAVARAGYLPALVGNDRFRLLALVDRHVPNALEAAACYRELGGGDLPEVVGRLEDVPAGVGAAVVATPAASHAEVASALLAAGTHTLIEKPLALERAECERIRAAAAVGGAVARPALVRRLYPSSAWVAAALAGGRLGRLRSIRWEQGQIFGWPLASAATVDPRQPGSGVLEDLAPHAFDLLTRWLGGTPSVEWVAANGDGAAASEVAVGMSASGAGAGAAPAGTPVATVVAEVHLSWLRPLANRCLLVGDAGTLAVGLGRRAEFQWWDERGAPVSSGEIPAADAEGDLSLAWLFRRQLEEFSQAVAGGPSQLASLDEGCTCVGLVESCRSLPRRVLPRPWQATRGGAVAGTRSGRSRGNGQRVAVTGATGFLGAALVERLAGAGGAAWVAPPGEVTAVARAWGRLARLSHLDGARLRVALADVRDREALVQAFRGCDVVVHAAFGNGGTPEEQWSVTVDGTAAALAAATACGVRRFVHVGSMATYDTTGLAGGDRRTDARLDSRLDSRLGPRLDEDCPALPAVPGIASYAQQKLAAEQLVARAAGGPMEVVSLQPSVIYGPWGPNWTVRPLRRLAAAADDLPSGSGGGVCNAIHVHDAADAAAFLASAPAVDGLRLLVTGPDQLGWGAFYDLYRDLLGIPRPARFDWSQARELYRSPVVVDGRRLAALGFVPRVGIAQGMAQVATWAAWFGLLGEAPGPGPVARIPRP
ncbi:MAG TPA: NAD-dependent epimerase/dehydratase family protein [Actinomycetota bacterium]|nr:NAD-dependent epimerase/dehydratase family protein [Actinomycetota bacterium]